MSIEQYTVVVADDEIELLEAVCQMIPWEEIGFRLVGKAGNGLEAFQLVEYLQPDLLLTDIRMPFISGLELARQVHELRPMTSIAFLSGYDDFGYAQKAIDYNVISYLLKPISMAELTEALKDIWQKIHVKRRALTVHRKRSCEWLSFVCPLLLDRFTTEQELSEASLAEQAAQMGLVSDPQQEVLITVLVSETHRNDRGCTDANAVFSIDRVLEKYYQSRSFTAGNRILTLLVTDQDFSRLPVALDELLQTMQCIWQLKCSVGVSHPVSQWSKCHNAYCEAIDALRFHRSDTEGIFWYLDRMDNNGEPFPDFAESTTALESLIRIGSRTDLETYLAGMFASDTGDMLVMQALAVVQRVLCTAFPADQVLQTRRHCGLADNLFARDQVQNMKRKVSHLCLTARDMLSEQRKDSMNLLCDQALEVINQEYMFEDLSLGSVSNKLHVSPNYLSANMKKYAGDTFTNLLIRKRMEEAGKLLQSTNLRVREVARKCGYSDQHYFSYCFKKYFGVSPLQLRRKETGEDQ